MRVARFADRNFWLGVANGVFVTGGEAFLHSGLVMAPFLAALGAPAVVIGLVPALKVGFWFLPQLLVANRLSHEPLKLRFYHFTSTVRTVALLVMTASVFLWGAERPGLVVALMLVMITINAIAGGIGGVPFADVTAKIVPHERLGTFWAMRNAIGGVLALGAGFVLRRVLASDLPFPINFGWVFLFGTVLSGIAYGSFSLVNEPVGVAGMKRPLIGMLRQIPGLVRTDPSLRRFLRVRFLGLATLLAEPFYAVYAIRVLGAPESALGLYVMAATATAILANFAFRGPADGGRNVSVLQAGYVLLALAPLAAFVIQDWRAYTLVFVLSGVGNAGVGIAAWNLLYAIAPAGERPLYIGLANSVLALPSLAPVLAGSVQPWVGTHALFLGAFVMGATTLAFSFRFGLLRELDRRALGPAAAEALARREAERRRSDGVRKVRGDAQR